MTKLNFQRDIFINELMKSAKNDKDIYFISADFGAPALDSFRDELPKQFIHSGISEQHMIDLAAGMALSNKKVFVHAMSPFISLRCIEQIKCLCPIIDVNQCFKKLSFALVKSLIFSFFGPNFFSSPKFFEP